MKHFIKLHRKQRKTSLSAKILNTETYYIFGYHAVEAAILNPKRHILELVATDNALKKLNLPTNDINTKIVDTKTISALLSEEAIHQGIACRVKKLPQYNLNELKLNGTIVLLDQITDPHNIGAILRSAAAFNAEAVILLKNNSPEENGTMAKAASGAMDITPLITVNNLSTTMEYLKTKGYWCFGMDGRAKNTMREEIQHEKIALIMGAEGKGLRRLTRENCDILVKLPMSNKVESLNVSNATAIALYEIMTSYTKF